MLQHYSTPAAGSKESRAQTGSEHTNFNFDASNPFLARTIQFSVGADRNAQVWAPQSATLADLFGLLTEHREDRRKDGLAVVFADLPKGARKKALVRSVTAVALDLDTGVDGAEVDAALADLGVLAVRHTTHSHTEGHPKHRVVIPLLEPFDLLAQGGDQQHGSAAWARVPQALGERLGLEIDKACVDPSRLFNLPRHRPGAPYEVSVFGGDLFDWRALDLVAPPVKKALKPPATYVGKKLRPWAKKHGAGFQIADAIEAYADDKVRGRNGEKLTVECPFDQGHSNAGDTDDQGFFVVNGGEGLGGGFVAHCSHHHCQHFDRLDFVGEMLAAEWFPADALESDDFNPVVEGEEPKAPPVTKRRKKRPVMTDEWMDRLVLTDKGYIVSNLPNLQLIVENDPRTRGIVGFNAFTGEVVLRTAPGRREGAGVQLAGAGWTVRDKINGDLWSDAHDDMLRAMLEASEDEGGYDLRVTDRDLAAAVHLAALGKEFHPLQSYLSGLVWDEKPRVESLFVDYLGSDDDAYHREAAQLMMVGAVARAFEPGMKVDESVILEGLQGKRKTTFIETLAVHWYGELDAAMDDSKGCVEQMQGCWIVELGELTGLAKADVRRVKSFLSRHTDKARLAYARRAREFPRACIFIGSTNDQAYLKDPTGGRRFLPVACKVTGTIDIERLRGEIGQLWAEAVHFYREMRDAQPVGRLPLWLSDEAARETARTLQASRTIDTADDMLTGQIEDWLNKTNKDRVCLREVWEVALCRDLDAYTNAWAAALGQIMRSLPDWEAKGTRESFEGYGQQRVFVRTPKPSEGSAA